MKQFFSIIICLFFSATFLWGQEINYYGQVKDLDSKKNLAGVTVTVLKNGSEVTSQTTTGNGKYSVNFATGASYKVKYSKPGYVSKIVELDVNKVVAEDMPAGGRIFPPINLDLFQEVPGVDFSFLDNEPVVKWYFDGGIMAYREGQMKKVKQKIEDKLKEKENQAKATDAEYNKLIKEADGFYDSGKYQEALNKYVAALQLPGKQKEEHPNARLIEIEDLLQQQEEENLAYKQENQEYLNLIEAADNFASNKEYQKAIDKYQEAINKKSDEQYPKDRIADLKKEADKIAKQKEYDKLIKRADGFFNQNSMKAARDTYVKAQRVLPEEEYPQKQLDIIDGKLEELQAIQAQKDKYNKAIEEADALYDAEDYQASIEKYNEALEFESAATYPQGRIDLAKEKLDEIAKEAQKQEEFNQLVTEADAHIANEEYSPAIEKLGSAFAIIEDPAVKEKLDSTIQLLEDKKNQAAKEQEIQALMVSAQEKLTNEEYAAAIEDFDAVLGLNETYQEAITAKEEAQKLLNEKEAQQAAKEAYESLVAEADQAFDEKNWEKSKKKYLAAQESKKDDQHVIDRLAEVESKIAQAKENDQINERLTVAQEKLDAEDFQGAISEFDAVLAIDENQTEAIEGKKNAEQLLADKNAAQEQEATFNDLVAEADQAFDNENWETAKEKYEAAKEVFEDRTHVNNRIDEINATLIALKNQKEQEEQIETFLKEAKELKEEKQWKEVVEKYEAAIEIDENREDIKELLSEAKENKKAWEAEQSQEELFNELKSAGDELFNAENWAKAKSKYEDALEIESNDDISANLKLIEEKLIEIEKQNEKEAEFQSVMASAEDLVDNESYASAIEKFKEAKELTEDKDQVDTRIEEVKALIAEKENANTEDQFTTAMTKGNDALETKDYKAAILSFEKALDLKPENDEVKTQKKKAQDLLEEVQSVEEEYTNYVENALGKYDEALADNNNEAILKEAKSLFESAENLRPNADLPKQKISEIETLLEEIEKAQELASNTEKINEEYKKQLDLAEVAAQDEKYENAINYLKEAEEIKPNESFPKEEIKRFQAILDKQSERQELNAEYSAALAKADKAFDNKAYENSIDLYKAAQKIKENEAYPASQIAKAKEALENIASQNENREYQNFMDKAEEQFLNEDYSAALTNYKAALKVKENDEDAKDRIDETQQILDNLAKQKQESLAQKKQFDEAIEKADKLFNNENYLAAKTAYEKALEFDKNSAYADSQIKLCIKKSGKKAEEKKKAKYENQIAEADKYYKNEQYESAIEAYKRALAIFEYEQYPKSQIAKSESAITAKVKAKGSVEYMGEKSNISILEGAALLEQGEIERERRKQEAVAQRLSKFEGEEEQRALSDFDERLQYENEVNSIKDLRVVSSEIAEEDRKEIADKVDEQIYGFEKSAAQMNEFKSGELSRAGREIEFVKDDFDTENKDYRALHKEAIEQIKETQNDREDQVRTERAHNEVKVASTNEELEELANAYNPPELKTEEYDKTLQLQDDAILAEIKVAESTEEKSIYQQQIKEDISDYEVLLQEKLAKEASEVHQEQMKLDDQALGAEKQFVESQEGKDDARQRAVEQLKDLDQEQSEQHLEKSEIEKEKTQESLSKVEDIKDIQTEKAIKNTRDMTVVDKEVKARQTAYERAQVKMKEEETLEHEQMENKIRNIENREEIVRSRGKEEIESSYENLKSLEKGLENKNLNIDEKARKSRQEAQQFVDALENDNVQFSERIANTIGDEYPEGVTQENYVRKDASGIPVKIVTRRIVVIDGRGEVYIRIQRRNGITYSKNGAPVAEQTWINGTEDANLEKHY